MNSLDDGASGLDGLGVQEEVPPFVFVGFLAFEFMPDPALSVGTGRWDIDGELEEGVGAIVGPRGARGRAPEVTFDKEGASSAMGSKAMLSRA